MRILVLAACVLVATGCSSDKYGRALILTVHLPPGTQGPMTLMDIALWNRAGELEHDHKTKTDSQDQLFKDRNSESIAFRPEKGDWSIRVTVEKQSVLIGWNEASVTVGDGTFWQDMDLRAPQGGEDLSLPIAEDMAGQDLTVLPPDMASTDFAGCVVSSPPTCPALPQCGKFYDDCGQLICDRACGPMEECVGGMCCIRQKMATVCSGHCGTMSDGCGMVDCGVCNGSGESCTNNLCVGPADMASTDMAADMTNSQCDSKVCALNPQGPGCVAHDNGSTAPNHQTWYDCNPVGSVAAAVEACTRSRGNNNNRSCPSATVNCGAYCTQGIQLLDVVGFAYFWCVDSEKAGSQCNALNTTWQ